MAVRDRDVERFLADERFSRIFTYPADPAQGRPEALRISYADYGYHTKDVLAKEYGVRIINADRPGFGETPDIKAEGRLAFWRRQVDKLASLFSVVSAPILETSFGLTTAFGRWFATQPAGEDAAITATDPAVAFAEALDPKLADFIYASPIQGISNESILLLQRTQGASGWADWGDYDTLVPRLRRTMAEKDRCLVVECFFSQTDSMIGDHGTVGPEWFKSCWSRDGKDDDAIQFSCRVINGADHNSIWATQWGVARDVFNRIRGTGS
ncbi:hypothetical protein TruAng_004909 [Truncatella angustata]|nr:hypothetical protein TruAng_004909 [Truncatella angustata]